MSEYQGIPHTTAPLYVVRADGKAGRVVGWQDAQHEGKWRAIAVLDGEPTAVVVDERTDPWVEAWFTDDYYTAFGRVEQVQP